MNEEQTVAWSAPDKRSWLRRKWESLFPCYLPPEPPPGKVEGTVIFSSYHFDWPDRFRLLVGGKLKTRVYVYTEEELGPHTSVAFIERVGKV